MSGLRVRFTRRTMIRTPALIALPQAAKIASNSGRRSEKQLAFQVQNDQSRARRFAGNRSRTTRSELTASSLILQTSRPGDEQQNDRPDPDQNRELDAQKTAARAVASIRMAS